jgi:heterodisulfide reductase subunit C
VAAPEEIQPLKVYWGSEFGVAFPDLLENPDPALLSEGKELHEASCAACHSRPQWAFLSFSLSRPLAPVAPVLDRVRVSFWLYYIHFLMCFIGLAYLPFSKFFHILSGPVSLLIKGVRDHGPLKPANQITQRAVGLDACMHCGTCSRHCSVGAVYRILPNRNILPSEKLTSVKALASRKKLDPSELQSIQEGSFICTACYRCTQMCPVGINLQDLWFASKEDLAEKGLPEPHVWARQAGNTEWMAKNTDPGVALVPEDPPIRQHLTRSNQAETFSACFECQTCTNVCPVVANFENPSEALDLAPHQIMHSLGLGLRDLMINSRMVWDCVTCYLCQEHCPQGVQVTDILYELKNLAYERAKTPSQQKDIST